MNKAGQFFLFLTIFFWGLFIGGILYSHIVLFPAYMGHLPSSTAMIDVYGVHDEYFWMFIHPAIILTLLIALVLNWKLPIRRKYILVVIGLYAAAILITALYFVPELKAFAKSANSDIPASEWIKRGERWQHFSWVRGAIMCTCFVFLLLALAGNKPKSVTST